MKKVLIISYYWPPAGGGGVMRWLKMSNYLSQESTWKPIIFKPKGANYLIKDETLCDQVSEIETIEYPIWEPNNILLRLGFKSVLKQVASGGIGASDKNQSYLKKFFVWVRSNFFIPDARAFWVKPASAYLFKHLKENPVDAIISTGPPHSVHLIANQLKDKLGVKWVVDYRDPWTFIDFFDDLNLTKRALNKHMSLEKEVMKNADAVVTVSKSWARELENLYNIPVEVIHNGYDPNDFKSFDLKASNKFTITHIGSLNKDRNPLLLWKTLSELKSEKPEMVANIKIRIIGTISNEVNEAVKAYGLESVVSIEHYMPHAEVLNALKSSNISMLLINDTSNKGGIIPGKLYEYLAIGNPILVIGNKEGDSAEIINQCKAGKIFGYNEVSALKNYLISFLSDKNQFKNEILEQEVQQFSRQKLALKYSMLLDKVTK